jgi:cysteine desulfurase
MLKKTVYFDYNATTPVNPMVLECMLPYFNVHFGNASSIHTYGWQASEAIDIAREQVAQLIAASPSEITFTSGATESMNMAIKGIAARYESKGKHIISFETEHYAVLESLNYLSSRGWEIQLLPVNPNGLPDLDLLEKAIRPDTVFIAAMLANNESGVVFPMSEITSIARGNGVLTICDATQACGKINVDVDELGVDVLALSAHKFYGPKGCGALYLRRRNPRVTIETLIHGGGQEGNRRSGTLNIPSIVGMGKAADLATQNVIMYKEKTMPLRDLLENELRKNFDVQVLADEARRLSNTSFFRIKGIQSSVLISKLHQFAFSTGSACSSSEPRPSHVAMAMGLNEEQAFEAVRLSLGIDSEEDDIHAFIQSLKIALHHFG